jgi:hypothetical protein
VICQNVTTSQTVQFDTSATSWDCEAAGLLASPGDRIRMTVKGKAR